MAKKRIVDDREFYKDREKFLKQFKKDKSDKAGKAARKAAGLKDHKR